MASYPVNRRSKAPHLGSEEELGPLGWVQASHRQLRGLTLGDVLSWGPGDCLQAWREQLREHLAAGITAPPLPWGREHLGVGAPFSQECEPPALQGEAEPKMLWPLCCDCPHSHQRTEDQVEFSGPRLNPWQPWASRLLG